MRRAPRALVTTLAALLLAATPSAATAAPFPDRIDLPAGYQPEGITTSVGTTVWAGSLAAGSLWRGDVRTGEGSVVYDGTDQVAVGIDYDERRELIWVAGGPTGEVRAHDAETGDVVATYTFAAGFLNDLVVTQDAVYVTDSFVQQLAVIPLDGNELPPASEATTLPLSGDLEYVDGFNANGIVATRGYLVLVQSATGLLFRVDPATGEAVEIDLGGYSVSAGDGLELRGSTLYVVRNQLNLVAEIRLGPGLLSGTVTDELTSDQLAVPTTATLAAGRLYAVNAQFGTPPEVADYAIVRVPLR